MKQSFVVEFVVTVDAATVGDVGSRLSGLVSRVHAAADAAGRGMSLERECRITPCGDRSAGDPGPSSAWGPPSITE